MAYKFFITAITLAFFLLACTDYQNMIDSEYGKSFETENTNNSTDNSGNSTTIKTCNGFTYDASTYFCNDGIVTKLCNTTLWSSRGCYSGSEKCGGVPYNPNIFVCSGSTLAKKCSAAYYGEYFYAIASGNCR